MASSTGKAQWCVIVVRGRFVDIGTFADQKLGGAVMSSTHGLHEGRSPALRLMFEVSTPFEEEVGHVSVASLAGK